MKCWPTTCGSFKILDLDGDGVISDHEVTNYEEKMRPGNP